MHRRFRKCLFILGINLLTTFELSRSKAITMAGMYCFGHEMSHLLLILNVVDNKKHDFHNCINLSF